jgi:ribonucleoside-diphosphate reductase alpha chain
MLKKHNQLHPTICSKMNKEIYWLNKDSVTFLERGYLSKGQTAEERIHQIAKSAEKILKKKGFADKFESYMHKGWYSLSSPIWANFGNGRGLSISCNGSYISDTMNSILEKTAEVGMLTKYGAGTSGFFGDLRSRGTPISVGGTSSGPVHFMEMFDAVTRVVSQSNVRRGSFAAYLPIEHPDIMEFLGIREEGHAIQDLSIGVCVSNKFMKKMIDGDKDARTVWAKVLKKRFESGYPYL